MMLIGLTGGMGSGKSTVSGMFEDLGIAVYNSDREARRLMNNSAAIRKAIVSLLGQKAYENSVPDRAYIAAAVFGNQELLDRLNAIIHPAVGRDLKKWLRKQSGPYVIQEAAILFENGNYRKFDKIILVCAPREVRIQRIKERDGLSRESIEARMAYQWDDERKAALSDYVIENLDLEDTRSQVNRIHKELLLLQG